MREHYKMFLSDNYLKYIGWTLSDKVNKWTTFCLVYTVYMYMYTVYSCMCVYVIKFHIAKICSIYVYIHVHCTCIRYWSLARSIVD